MCYAQRHCYAKSLSRLETSWFKICRCSELFCQGNERFKIECKSFVLSLNQY